MNPPKSIVNGMSPKDEVRVAFQLPSHVVKDLDHLADKPHQTRSQMYRWIAVRFMESVRDKNEPPAIPAILELARRVDESQLELQPNKFTKRIPQ